MTSANKILLTGVTGFLGSNLAKKMVDKNYQVIALKRSFSDMFRIGNYSEKILFYDLDKVSIESVFKTNKFNTIVHCATNYGKKNNNPIETINANLILPLNLLYFASEYHVPNFINTDTILDKRVNTYSLSKKQFLDWLVVYSKTLKCINISLEHFYGPFDDKTKFVSNIIHDVLIQKDSINLTPGEQKRDFIYIDDVIDAFATIIEKLPSIEENYINFEVGVGNSITIKDFVSSIKKIAGNDITALNFGAIPYRENEVMESHANIGPLVNLGWQPKYTVKDGLQRTIDLEKKLL